MSSAFMLPSFLISRPKVDRVYLVSRNLTGLSNNICRNIVANKVIVMERGEKNEDHDKVEVHKSRVVKHTILIILLAFCFLCPKSLGPLCYLFKRKLFLG